MRMYKKLITLILVLTMVLSQGVLTPLAAEQSIYSEEIEVIKALGIMVGDENGDFGAQNNLTRAEFANVFTVLLQINDSDTAKENAWYFKAGEDLKNQVLDGEKVQRFTDVPADHWAYGVIEQVTSRG
ncbi:MAG: S-layer homology domain-containing protein [Clostridia bacterium]|nr:S-layer homology domain-containing protein [Clostridia bacterium]